MSRQFVISSIICIWLLFSILSHLDNIDSSIKNEGASIDELDISTSLELVQNVLWSRFIENQGQIKNSEVRYYGRIPDGIVYFCSGKINFRFFSIEKTI